MPNTLTILTNWRNITKSGHTDHHPMLREALALNTVVKMGLFFSGIVSDAKSDKIPPILFINLDGKNESITSPSFSVSFFVGLCINLSIFYSGLFITHFSIYCVWITLSFVLIPMFLKIYQGFFMTIYVYLSLYLFLWVDLCFLVSIYVS